mmetsp:Transcript_13214/g.15043  ORF Transcript_13214/g.15043 Transcript_13214/m.15043 type:complete len:283 (-) Transcript_13214:104-952(-)|eukprot:CAMPEP_0204854206 /NCGR_PEP_ID=MMETSP1347-20130617/14843_1 /ASSEMBLY_ACC=CAM_ASM_000690 /TAXON_ID=215587 /ORGANISM="Aplanochytrium stocchinoi, Strain GSBS06" /LENGTH=282 /DNA_ID=CAMNT_0051999667 /DNA_START=302 /DNA_END=1150 /DNA_ORIENTATION=-
MANILQNFDNLNPLKYGIGVTKATDSSLSVEEFVALRLEQFKNICTAARKAGCALTLMPEFSFTSLSALNQGSKNKTKEYGVLLPESDSPKDKGNELFQSLKLLAKNDGNMMTSFNVSEIDENENLYNTTLVFSNTGEVLAAYRKQNVWFTSVYETPKENVCVFEKNGINYGMLTCYDILNTEPSKSLRNSDPKPDVVIYPVASFGILGKPFSVSQRLWSWKNNCVLLSSDLNASRFSSSGVYRNGSSLLKKRHRDAHSDADSSGHFGYSPDDILITVSVNL